MPRRPVQRICQYCHNALPRGMHRCTCTVIVQTRPRVCGYLRAQKHVLRELDPNILPTTSKEQQPLKRPRLTENQQPFKNPVQLLLQPQRRCSPSPNLQQASVPPARPRHAPFIDPFQQSIQQNPPPNSLQSPPPVYDINELIPSQPHHSDADDIESS